MLRLAWQPRQAYATYPAHAHVHAPAPLLLLVRAVAGLDELLMSMQRGEIARALVPPEKHFGAVGYPPHIPKGESIVYEVELLAFGLAVEP